MKKTIEVNGIMYTYDIPALLKSLQQYSWEEPYGVCHGNGKSWMEPTQESFDKGIAAFTKLIENLDKTAEKLLKKQVLLTKLKLLHKSKRYVIIDSGVCTRYSDEHGSHAYSNICLHLQQTGDRKATLVINELSFQESF